MQLDYTLRHAQRGLHSTWSVCQSVCLSTTILALQAMKRHQSDTNSSSATSARKINDGVHGRVTGSVEDCHAVDGPPPKTAPRNVHGSRNWSPPATHAPPPHLKYAQEPVSLLYLLSSVSLSSSRFIYYIRCVFRLISPFLILRCCSCRRRPPTHALV